MLSLIKKDETRQQKPMTDRPSHGIIFEEVILMGVFQQVLLWPGKSIPEAEEILARLDFDLGGQWILQDYRFSLNENGVSILFETEFEAEIRFIEAFSGYVNEPVLLAGSDDGAFQYYILAQNRRVLDSFAQPGFVIKKNNLSFQSGNGALLAELFKADEKMLQKYLFSQNEDQPGCRNSSLIDFCAWLGFELPFEARQSKMEWMLSYAARKKKLASEDIPWPALLNQLDFANPRLTLSKNGVITLECQLVAAGGGYFLTLQKKAQTRGYYGPCSRDQAAALLAAFKKGKLDLHGWQMPYIRQDSPQRKEEPEEIFKPQIDVKLIKRIIARNKASEQIFEQTALTAEEALRLLQQSAEGKWCYFAVEFELPDEPVYVKKLKKTIQRTYRSELVLHSENQLQACLFFDGKTRLVHLLIGDRHAYTDVDSKDLRTITVGEVQLPEYAVHRDNQKIKQALPLLFSDLAKGAFQPRQFKSWSTQNYNGGLNTFNELRRTWGAFKEE